MDNKINKYLERYLKEISKRSSDGVKDEEGAKRIRRGDNVKRLIERFETPMVGKISRSRMTTVGQIYIPTNVIECLDDICRKESRKFTK